MNRDDNKKRWKDESDQLKKDLANRPKEIRQQKVDIKFGGKKKNSLQKDQYAKPNATPYLSNKSQDDYLRYKLGL